MISSLSRGLKLGTTLAAILLVGAAARPPKEAERPKIFRIEQVEIFSTNQGAAKIFYGRLMGLGEPCHWCESAPTDWMFLPSGQMLKLSATPAKPPKDLIASITFAIDDAKAMKRLLKSQHVAFREVSGIYRELPGLYRTTGSCLSVVDPEGHQLYFVEAKLGGNQGSSRSPSLIHTGFVVKDRDAMDKFYKDILGFHVYWHGGMKEGETNWVDMQLPDGTDWVEYMLGVPPDADKRLLGVMNHIALGVASVKEADDQLEKAGMKLTEQPKIGRDGKWQLNLYDPDETRVELMEFTPTQKPCCSEYTGKHPGP